MIEVTGTIADRDLGSIVGDLKEAIAAMNIPLDYELRFGGEYEEQQESFQQMTFAAILALVLVYMVMAAQFESLRDPFIILFSIPLAGIGVVTMLIFTETTFNMQGFLGLIVLVGIVVNNAIVLVDYTNLLRREHGYSLREAVVMAGTRRLRPILMTTVTTVLGLTPMALGLGEGGELQAPMARVVIGGLTTSTLITLVFIPVVYFTLEGWSETDSRAQGNRSGRRPSPGRIGGRLSSPAVRNRAVTVRERSGTNPEVEDLPACISHRVLRPSSGERRRLEPSGERSGFVPDRSLTVTARFPVTSYRAPGCRQYTPHRSFESS